MYIDFLSTALIVIDVQQAFDHQQRQRNNQSAEKNIMEVIDHFRKHDGNIVHVRHISDSQDSLFFEGSETSKFKPEAIPLESETTILKTVNSAFIGTDLEQQLRKENINTLFIVGLTAPHCVSTTTRMASNLGFNCILVEDATASFELTDHLGRKYSAQEIHDGTMASLNEEFAEILITSMVVN